MAADTPVIPQTITVHLGRPNAAARNVTVPFTDYLKNVASSEIYPTWPDNAIRANIYAQASFALNRIYTEHYRSRGYDFDITNSTAYDQAYIEGRSVFSNVAKIVDELFNNYVTKGDQVQPYFTQYCSGREVTCDGLSQWGTVTLANQGYTPYRRRRSRSTAYIQSTTAAAATTSTSRTRPHTTRHILRGAACFQTSRR